MLADTGYLENLTESLRRQRIDDSFKGECFGHLRNTVGFQQAVPCRIISSRTKTLVYQEPLRTNSVDKTSTNSHNRKTKLSSMSTEITKPVQEVKPHKTFKEISYLKPKAPLPEICSPLIQKDLLDKPETSLEILSSSEEELRELCSNQNKTFRILNQIPHRVPNTSPGKSLRLTRKAEKNCTNETNSGFEDNDDKDMSRKRNKTFRGSFKKKMKLSRPSLNMDKMLATRLSLTKDHISNGNNFYPIENV